MGQPGGRGRGGRRAVVEGFYGLPDDMGLTDPGALGVRETDGDGVAAGLELADEGVDVRGGMGVGGAVVVYD